MNWNYSIIGSNIKDIRESKGLKQWQIANALGLTNYKIVSNWETNRSKPSWPILKKLAIFFNVQLNEITKGAEKTNEKPITRQDIKEALKEALLESQVVIYPLTGKNKLRG